MPLRLASSRCVCERQREALGMLNLSPCGVGFAGTRRAHAVARGCAEMSRTAAAPRWCVVRHVAGVKGARTAALYVECATENEK